jgi:ubiquinone/menaquinone biosynthesis C-methylase UbiE
VWATACAAARAAAPGHVLGVDLSESILARGRASATIAGLANAAFERADAQVHTFGEASFDAVISRHRANANDHARRWRWKPGRDG